MSQRTSCAPTPTVLVVEDDEPVRIVVCHSLRLAGYAPVEAHNGQEALRVLATGLRPDLILLDLLMPVMDGLVFLRYRATAPELASIPVIILSAWTRDEMWQDPLLDGLPMVAKPFSPDALTQALAKELGTDAS